MLRRLLMVSVLLSVSAHAEVPNSGKPFAVAGERVDAPLLAGTKLAYMAGDGKGEFIAEFADPKEDIALWQKRFVAQQRVNDTLPNTVKRTLHSVRSACSALGKPEVFAPQKEMAKFKGDMLALRFHCQQAMPNAPLGELTAMLFLQGQQHTFKYWRSWRPQNQQQLQEALKESNRFFSSSLKDADLCNPQASRACRNPLLPQ